MKSLEVAVLTTAADLAVKRGMISDKPDDYRKELFKGKLLVMKRKNQGVFYGLLKNKPELVKKLTEAGTGALCVAAIFTRFFKKTPTSLRYGYAIAAGGAVSNLFEREKDGEVTDYLNIPNEKFKLLNKIVFNLGDVAIFIGAGMLYFGFSGLALKNSRKKRKIEKAAKAMKEEK